MSTQAPLVQFHFKTREEPFRLFRKWYQKAESTGATDAPNGMTLATCTPDGDPSARIVLLKQVLDEGFVFFTNYASHKGADLDANPRAAIVLWWPDLKRQVRVTGSIVRTSAEVSDAYYQSRPLTYRLGAWASKQSQVLPERLALAKAFVKLRKKYKNRDVPRPPHWGGFILQPERFEFWEERASRLHERRVFTRDGDAWTLNRLYP